MTCPMCAPCDLCGEESTATIIGTGAKVMTACAEHTDEVLDFMRTREQGIRLADLN